MGYTALHPDWGRLDASLDDLGCGRDWSEVHRVKGVELSCPECRGRVFARVSVHRDRHFYHQMRPDECELANESLEHHLLKLELALAARAAGWRAELEVSSETRNWRADVMVFDERGRPFMALEAQLSPMTPEDARMRTDRYAHDGVAVCWFGMHDRPWERTVPSLQVRFPGKRGEPWTVRRGMARYSWAPRTLKAKAGWVRVQPTLADAIRWILDGRAHVYTSVNGTVRWTAPAYTELALARARMEAEAEAAERAAAAEQRRQEAAARAAVAAEFRRRAAERARHAEAERQTELRRLAGFFRHAGMDAVLWPTFTQMVRSASGKAIVYGEQSPAHGDGLLVYTRPRWGTGTSLAGVVCPDPRALALWPQNLTIVVHNQAWLARLREGARTLLKVAVLNPVTEHSRFFRIGPDEVVGTDPEAWDSPR
ncbi:competence protein CoiA family protein [Streptomyces sp. NPDC048603]|uniref:competence protein CoiA family protein n=1 Tax=Streptomyces sp. NPDC048603 TaxID=3365577 RepID=UPI003715DE20